MVESFGICTITIVLSTLTFLYMLSALVVQKAFVQTLCAPMCLHTNKYV